MLTAQDFVVQKDGQRREGEILGVVDGKLKIKVGPAETGMAMDQIASVTKAAPKEYEDAIKAWQEGNANKTLSLLKPVVEAFRGLPTEWAERAAALLGDVYLSLGPTSGSGERFCRVHDVLPKCHLPIGYWSGKIGRLQKGFCSCQGEASADRLRSRQGCCRAGWEKRGLRPGVLFDGNGA